MALFPPGAEQGSYQQWPEPEHPVQLLTLPEWRAASHGAGVPCGRRTLGLGEFAKTLVRDNSEHVSRLIPPGGLG